MYKHFFKRLIDFTIALCALLVIWPFLLIITIWLHFANKGAGAFFTQERPGKDGKVFKVIKFKSMTDARDENGKLLPNDQRITKVGAFLRKTSIDELPQLVNVLKGDMALIGPRPLLPEYLPYYTRRESLRHSVRVGITGLAQVSGRNNLSWNERLEMDAYYAEHVSLALDMKIILRTIKNVLSRKDVVVALDEKKNLPLNVYRTTIDNNASVVTIRPLTEECLDRRVQLLNMPEVSSNLNTSECFDIKKTKEWFKNRNLAKRFDCVFVLGSDIIGMGGLTNISKENKNAELYIYLSPQFQGHGLGFKSLKLLCKYGFEELKLHKIYLYTFASNIRANKMYEKAGFVREGLLREHTMKNGHLQDRYIYGLLTSGKY